MYISEAVDLLIQTLWWLMFIRIFLTWIPSINWYNQPFLLLRTIVDPVFEPFKRLIPPINGLDLSPIAAFIFLSILRTGMNKLLVGFGL